MRFKLNFFNLAILIKLIYFINFYFLKKDFPMSFKYII
jgi:hypothetical protein